MAEAKFRETDRLMREALSGHWQRLWESWDGGFPERSKGSDCKSDGSAFTGSNPVPPILKELDFAAETMVFFTFGERPVSGLFVGGWWGWTGVLKMRV